MPDPHTPDVAAQIAAQLDAMDIIAATGKPWRELFDHSYSTWARNYRAWQRRTRWGGTRQLKAIMWYQHICKPGSTDSRPGVILPALCAACEAEVEG